MADEVSFNEFVEKTYAGIPDRTTTVEQKKKAIEAKKKILAHPDCPASVRTKLYEEIATIQGEIDGMKAQQHEEAMNKSVFPPRDNLG